MKIDTIFVGYLYAIHYDNETENELKRLLNQWVNVRYLKLFAQKNKIHDTETFVKALLKDLEDMEDAIDEIDQDNKKLKLFFQPLYNEETGLTALSLQKAKRKNNRLRFYAIRIHENLFLITGGAIKMTQEMKDHPQTEKERLKLYHIKDWLKDNSVIDDDSFYEFLKEEND